VQGVAQHARLIGSASRFANPIDISRQILAHAWVSEELLSQPTHDHDDLPSLNKLYAGTLASRLIWIKSARALSVVIITSVFRTSIGLQSVLLCGRQGLFFAVLSC
jgi:hypothetical protein